MLLKNRTYIIEVDRETPIVETPGPELEVYEKLTSVPFTLEAMIGIFMPAVVERLTEETKETLKIVPSVVQKLPGLK